MAKSRVEKSVRNSAFIVGSKILQLVFAFVFRTILIRYLGAEILGIEGLFSSILTVLNMADMGISTAIIYMLYKPLAEGDDEKTFAIMSFFQKFYTCVGAFILVAGLALIPALPYIVKIPEGTLNVSLIYTLTIFATAVSYFLSSRRVIFEADQETFRMTIVDFVYMVVAQVGQIALLLTTKNYIAVLIMRMSLSAVFNIFVYFYARKKYPLFIKNRKAKLNKVDKKALFSNTGAVLIHKLGSVLVMGTDNIIISVFVNTVAVGLYSNYLLIIGNVGMFVTLMIAALTPSVGNLKATSEDIEHHYKTFRAVNMVTFLASAFTAVCIFNLSQEFISAWIGKEYLLSGWVILILSANYYISTMRFGIGTYCSAAGYFKQTMFKPILEGVINLIVSLVLVRVIGMAGVFLGTTASLVCGSLWVDPYVTYKKWFKKPVRKYFGEYGLMLAATVAVGAIGYGLSSLFVLGNAWLNFFAKAAINIAVSGGLLVLMTCKTQGFNTVMNRIKNLLHRNKPIA